MDRKTTKLVKLCVFVSFLMMVFVTPLTAQQLKNVVGTVTDANTGETIPAVSIKLKRTNAVITTDANGKYGIRANDKDYLIFSYVGYETRTLMVGAKTTLNVALKSVPNALNEVVVIGYGAVKKSDLTGSVGIVNMDDLIKAPVASFAEALAGRIAGVQVSSSDGQPGVGMDIVIRGANSLTQSNSPLYVIDGFPVEEPDNAALNPDDILSINILKDASATAIYGSRGANGVIIIETKKGKIGKPVVALSNSFGFQQPQKTIKMMNAYEFVKLQTEISATNAAASYFQNGRNLEFYRTAESIDWQDKVLRQAPMQIHNISLRGGTSQTRYSISGSIFDQEGIILNTGSNRYQGRVTIDQTISKKIKVGVTANYSKIMRNGQLVAAGGNANFTAFMMYRTWAYRPTTGTNVNLIDYDDDPDNTNVSDLRINPVVSSLNDYTRTGTTDFTANAYLQYDILKELSLKITGTTNSKKSKLDRFFNSKTPQGSPLNRFNSLGVNGSVRNLENEIWSNENILTYNKTFNKDHKLTVMGGFSIQSSSSNSYGYSAQGLPNEELGMPGLDEGKPFGGVANASDNALMSLYGRIEYNYKSKYLLTATYRADGSSKFYMANRWGYFPSAAFAWNMQKEYFMKSWTKISNAKLRISYGVTGNNRIGDFDYFSNLALPMGNSYSFNNGTPTQSIVLSKLGNPKLKWESTEQANIGYDLGLFNNRLEFTVDVYRKTTRDLLLNADMPAASGYAKAFKNIGSIRNDGMEYSLNTINISSKTFNWSTGFNISFNKNKVLALARNQERMFSTVRVGQDSPQLYVSEIGKPAGLFYGRIFDGVYQYEDFENPSPGVYVLKKNVPGNGQTVPIQPGHIKYRDINGDGVVDDNDMTVIGSGQPLHTGGFLNNLSYKGISLSVFLQWSYGNQIYNANRMMLDGNYLGLANTNQYASYVNRWSPENPTNENYKPGGHGPAGAQSTRVLEDGSYIRLKTVSLGYSIPSRYIKKMYMSSLSLVVSAQNLYTFTNYSGMDPEVSVLNSVLTPGFDYSAYPQARTLNFALKASF
ncbi:SusC/RagA family TonB-linked outer membrane protein [Pedobacter nyackensis]|uniref:TonB-linked outer membrane protein, SusC/RagA family n=1 Tax=Pedobacter nyackensis TaxID=475255 RepID=A0A1W2EX51_9SPHI|nr:TonB-dependent receptor [Pedobacter nyackensis]SMD14274.1 TonB-linked outer membrane protein, SusC/RagA family [Pedobacter nyackensis]